MSKSRWLVASILFLFLFTFVIGTNRSFAEYNGFNGDGFYDLAIGIVGEDYSTTQNAGSVNVLLGGVSGITSVGEQVWFQSNIGGTGTEANDGFGSSLAIGDFNGDGYFDLAIGVPFEDVGSVHDAGAVNVVYGSTLGLTSDGQYWDQNVSGMGGEIGENDFFGYALAAGDYNGDGYDDLAIGIPKEDLRTQTDVGAVTILYGSDTGLSASPDFLNPGISRWSGEEFGTTLATGDFNHDGYDDLAVSSPYRDYPGGGRKSGYVIVFSGSSSNLSVVDYEHYLSQGSSNIQDTAENNDNFGLSLAVGDFNNDSFDDLAIGVPNEDRENPTVITDTGVINVVYGSESGITRDGDKLLSQNSPQISDSCEEGDQFGYALAAGDFDGDGYDDLAVGVPFEDLTDADIGIVQILPGSDNGFDSARDQLWYQGSPGILGDDEEYDKFGYSLAAGNFNKDGYDDLVIGVPCEDVGSKINAGAINLLYGGIGGLIVSGNQLLYQGHNGLQGTPEEHDQFGYALAAVPGTRKFTYLPFVKR